MARILLVEDNELNRDMLSRRLNRNGFEVVIAVNGLEGAAGCDEFDTKPIVAAIGEDQSAAAGVRHVSDSLASANEISPTRH